MGGTINILSQPMFWKNFPKPSNDEFVKSHIPYVVHASTSSARTEYQ